MWLLGCFRQLLGCCYVVALVFCVVAVWLLGLSGWLLVCCYVVAKVFRLFARVLLCGF